MNEQTKMDKEKVRVLLLYILKYLNLVCETANIPCYASGGTCLGAIRHKGFIPWDDDIDYMIPRTYYDIFIETCAKLLPSNILVRSRENDPYFCCEYIKLCFKDEERGYSDLSIDVFFLDNTNPQRKLFRWYQNFWLIQLYFIKLYKVSKDKKGEFYSPRNPIKKLFYWIMSLLPYEKIEKWHKSLMILEKHNTDYYVNWGSCYSYKKATYKKDILGIPKKTEFENTTVYIAEKAEEIMKQLYGSTYMELPPLDKRTDHGVREFKNIDLNIEEIKKELNL